MMNIKLLNILVLLAVLTTCQVATGQGFEKIFGGAKTDFGTALVETPDGGYVIAGYSESFGADNDFDVYLIRTDVQGEEIWSNIYDEGLVEHAYEIIATEDGGFLIVGDFKLNGSSSVDAYLLKVNADGILQWSHTYGSAEWDEQGVSVTPSAHGGYVLAGVIEYSEANKDVFLVKTNSEGEEIWTKTIGSAQSEQANKIVAFENGYIIAGKADNDATHLIDAYLVRIDENGEVIWERNYGGFEIDEAKDVIISTQNEIVFTGLTNNNSNIYFVRLDGNGDEIMSETFGGVFGDVGASIIETNEGNFVIAGDTEVTTSNIDVYLMEITPNGNRLWVQNIGKTENVDFGTNVIKTQAGGFAIVGYQSPFENILVISDINLIVTDALGNINSTYIQGHIVQDNNDNCSVDGADASLKNWIVTATKEEVTYFGTSNENGFYSILVDTGNYMVKVLPQNEYWVPCIPSYNPHITGIYDTLTLNFPINVGINCPYLEVDVSAPILSNCDDVTYTVEYCNTGTGPAENAYVEVTIDSFLVAVNSTSIDIAGQTGNTFTFNLGTIEQGACANFKINATLDCANFITGLSHQISSHIYPDFTCATPDPLWDGSSIRVTGECEQDNVKFSIKNIGDNQTEDSIQYFIVEDVLMTLKKSILLDPDEEVIIPLPANGSTYRIVATQSTGHPGHSFPTVAVEGCAADGEAIISTGFVTQFPEDDADNFVSIDVQETMDANAEAPSLRGYPKGYGDEHFIQANTDITYNIRFENTTAQTIRQVVIRDTLPESLDLTTVRMGASSHAYTMETYGRGILKITFDEVALASGEAGYVKFRIAQKENNPVLTEIVNRAAIYLNYHAPMMTNQVRHTVGGEDYLDFVEITGTNNVAVPNVAITVSPNPFTETAQFEIKGKNYRTGIFSLYDMQGKLMSQNKFSGNQFEFSRGVLTRGIYFYHLQADGEFLNSGKIVVQ